MTYQRDPLTNPNVGVRSFKEDVDVQNFASVIAAIETTTHNLQEAVEELKKIRTGTGLILGQEIEEAK